MMESEFSIRSFAYPDDFSEVIELWQNAGEGVHLGRSDTVEEIEKKLDRDPELFLVAVSEGNIVGAVLGGFDGRRGLIYHLAVKAEFRKQGLGDMLMNEVELRLKSIGCRRAYLLVTKENDNAMYFYQKRGWEEMDRLHILAKDLD